MCFYRDVLKARPTLACIFVILNKKKVNFHVCIHGMKPQHSQCKTLLLFFNVIHMSLSKSSYFSSLFSHSLTWQLYGLPYYCIGVLVFGSQRVFSICLCKLLLDSTKPLARMTWNLSAYVEAGAYSQPPRFSVLPHTHLATTTSLLPSPTHSPDNSMTPHITVLG